MNELRGGLNSLKPLSRDAPSCSPGAAEGPRYSTVEIENSLESASSSIPSSLAIDARRSFDNIRHHQVLEKVARRVNDIQVLHLLKLTLKAAGKKGVAQGGVLSPLLSNLYLTEVDKMLERAKEVTHYGPYTYVEYCRFADDVRRSQAV